MNRFRVNVWSTIYSQGGRITLQ